MSAGHTPGPWKAVHDLKCTNGELASGVVSESTGCAVAWAHGRNDAEMIANARQLSASLQMMEACEFVLANAFRHKWDGDERAYTLIRAALAKARPTPGEGNG